MGGGTRPAARTPAKKLRSLKVSDAFKRFVLDQLEELGDVTAKAMFGGVGLYHAGLGVATGSAFLPAIAPSVDPVIVFGGFAVLAAVALIVTRGRLGFSPDVASAPAASGIAAA